MKPQSWIDANQATKNIPISLWHRPSLQATARICSRKSLTTLSENTCCLCHAHFAHQPLPCRSTNSWTPLRCSFVQRQQTCWHSSADDGADSPVFFSNLPILVFPLVLQSCTEAAVAKTGNTFSSVWPNGQTAAKQIGPVNYLTQSCAMFPPVCVCVSGGSWMAFFWTSWSSSPV